jgi:hypothetical protein
MAILLSARRPFAVAAVHAERAERGVLGVELAF